jgi:hypothetical protein
MAMVGVERILLHRGQSQIRPAAIPHISIDVIDNEGGIAL